MGIYYDYISEYCNSFKLHSVQTTNGLGRLIIPKNAYVEIFIACIFQKLIFQDGANS